MRHLLLNLAIAEGDGAVGEFTPARIVAHNDDGSPVLASLVSKNFADVFSGLGIERGGWVLPPKERRIFRPGPRHGDAPRFFRAEFIRPLIETVVPAACYRC